MMQVEKEVPEKIRGYKPMSLHFVVRDLETGAILAESSEQSFPWNGASWLCGNSMNDQVRGFLLSHATQVYKQLIRKLRK